jgi:hypothetical protein
MGKICLQFTNPQGMQTLLAKAAGPPVTSYKHIRHGALIIGKRPDAHNYKREEVLNEYIQKQLGE